MAIFQIFWCRQHHQHILWKKLFNQPGFRNHISLQRVFTMDVEFFKNNVFPVSTVPFLGPIPAYLSPRNDKITLWIPWGKHCVANIMLAHAWKLFQIHFLLELFCGVSSTQTLFDLAVWLRRLKEQTVSNISRTGFAFLSFIHLMVSLLIQSV